MLRQNRTLWYNQNHPSGYDRFLCGFEFSQPPLVDIYYKFRMNLVHRHSSIFLKFEYYFHIELLLLFFSFMLNVSLSSYIVYKFYIKLFLFSSYILVLLSKYLKKIEKLSDSS